MDWHVGAAPLPPPPEVLGRCGGSIRGGTHSGGGKMAAENDIDCRPHFQRGGIAARGVDK